MDLGQIWADEMNGEIEPGSYSKALDEQKWEAHRQEHADEYAKVKDLQAQGHNPHCAYRMVFGDGQCTCRAGGND